jgi:hypothetical protein
MAEALSAPVGLLLWLNVVFGVALAISLIVGAELLARYVEKHRMLSQKRPQQSPAPSEAGLRSAELFGQL